MKTRNNNEFFKNKKMEVKTPNSTCFGLTNRCDDGEYILFADYDKIYLHVLLKELKNVFLKHKKYLTNFAIFESTESILTGNGTLGSFHVVSFGKLPYQKMREILSYMTVDDDFFKLPKTTAYRTNTLRVSPKYKWEKDGNKGLILKKAPKFLTWFPEERHGLKVVISEAHIKAYKKYIPKFFIHESINNIKWDKLKMIEFKKYNSFGV